MGLEEMLDLVDESGVVIGRASRAACHADPALLHPVAHVLVFRSNGSLILQLRSQRKDCYPGLWDTSVGGHLEPGEEPRDGAAREMREELGLAFAPIRFLYSYIWRTERESELVFAYKAYCQGPVRPNTEEIDEVRDWRAAEIEAALGTGIFTASFEHEWDRYCRYQASRQD